MPKFTLKSIIKFLNSIIDILIPIIAVSLLLGVVFGPDAPFVGSIYLNINQVISMIGQDGLLGLIAIIIILFYIRKNQ
jgi:hypothetical protein|tara:strand:+ start:543 stop:776 length:234 start_codon:yes stop_codon:yes gene_type:complete